MRYLLLSQSSKGIVGSPGSGDNIHLAQQAMAAALAAGATQDEAITAGQAVMAAATGAYGTAHMMD